NIQVQNKNQNVITTKAPGKSNYRGESRSLNLRARKQSNLSYLEQAGLFTQVHRFLLVQLAEKRIVQVFDKADCLAGRLHFGTQFLIDFGELVEGKHGFLNGKSFQFALDLEILQLICAQHYFGGDVDKGHIVGLGNEWHSPGSPRICFDHVDLFVFNGELDIQQTAYVQRESQFPGIFFHLPDDVFRKLERW